MTLLTRTMVGGGDGERGEGVVDDKGAPVGMRDVGEHGEVGDTEGRVRHRLRVHHLGLGRERARHGGSVGDVDEGAGDATLLGEELGEERPGA